MRPVFLILTLSHTRYCQLYSPIFILLPGNTCPSQKQRTAEKDDMQNIPFLNLNVRIFQFEVSKHQVLKTVIDENGRAAID